MNVFLFYAFSVFSIINIYYLNTDSKLCLHKQLDICHGLPLPYPPHSEGLRVAEARGPMEPVVFLLTEQNLRALWAHVVHWIDATKPLSLH